MVRYFSTTVLVVMVLLRLAEALAFGGGLIVFDPTNFARNKITAAQMLLQVANSNEEVRMLLQNLEPTLGAYYGMEQYLRALQEVIVSGDPALQLHYYLPQIESAMRERYPGYVRPEHWNDAVAAAATTQLNVQTGLLNTVREELRPEDDVRLEGLLDTLRLKTELAAGNLDVQQAGNYLTILGIQEQRRTRHMVGALTNALTTRFAHDINEVAQPEAAMRLWLETAQVETLPYSGVGGVRTLDPIP